MNHNHHHHHHHHHPSSSSSSSSSIIIIIIIIVIVIIIIHRTPHPWRPSSSPNTCDDVCSSNSAKAHKNILEHLHLVFHWGYSRIKRCQCHHINNHLKAVATYQCHLYGLGSMVDFWLDNCGPMNCKSQVRMTKLKTSPRRILRTRPLCCESIWTRCSVATPKSYEWSKTPKHRNDHPFWYRK